METTLEPSMHTKPFEAGSGIEFKILDDKILITGQSRTFLKEKDFILDAQVIHIEAGSGIKISSRGKDTLVISANITKMEEEIFDFNKRISIVEKSLVSVMNILKALKVVK